MLTSRVEPLVIPSGSAASNGIRLAGAEVTALSFPAAFTGNKIRFQGSVDGTNFYDLVDATGAGFIEAVFAANLVYAATVAYKIAPEYIRIVSKASGGADQNEAASRTMALVVRA